MKKELIHARKITVNCYETDEEALVIEGSLIDERFFPFQIHAINERREPGPIHHIGLTMKLSVPQLEIISLDADMPVVPDAGCREIKDALQRLAGRRIRPGFTNETRELFGRTEGCLHLTNLLLAMSSAAIQGLWSYFSRIRQGKTPPLPPTDPLMFLDSCYMWRADGPFAERIERRRNAAHNSVQRPTAAGSPDE